MPDFSRAAYTQGRLALQDRPDKVLLAQLRPEADVVIDRAHRPCARDLGKGRSRRAETQGKLISCWLLKAYNARRYGGRQGHGSSVGTARQADGSLFARGGSPVLKLMFESAARTPGQGPHPASFSATIPIIGHLFITGEDHSQLRFLICRALGRERRDSAPRRPRAGRTLPLHPE